MGHSPERRLQLRITGVVQGVGFRPHVHQLAAELQLRGWVRNGDGGVELELEGPLAQLELALARLQGQPPPRSRIDQLEQRWLAPSGKSLGFQILATEPTGRGQGCRDVITAAISPDLAICPRCLAELEDPGNRRYGYPFISCTNCGPRYSVLRQLPFERDHTSLAAWPLCASCRQEYGNPGDHRFHAQTISCPACGPRLHWQDHAGSTTVARSAESAQGRALAAAAAALRQGRIVAVQGIGGFQLLVDPHNAGAVAELRRRKGRPDKPLALLASASWLERCCQLNRAERELWWSAAAPILLLSPRSSAAELRKLAPAVAAGSPWLGVMRPASGLQHVLLQACGEVLVATSANRSGEPIATDPQRDGSTLAELADAVLSHGLRIVNRIDDSVLRLAAGQPLVLRLGRGLAPLTLPDAAPPGGTEAVALGAQSKGGLALRLPQALVLSPDLGDLSSSAGSRHLETTTAAWLQRHRLTPATIHCDQHPGYSASQLAAALARERQLPLRPVQHHHAHLLAVMAEHGLTGEQVGVAFDGSGQGDDGQLWGGEALAVSTAGYRRLARLRPFPLPGGELAQREPRRAALGLLIGAWGETWRERAEDHGPLPCLTTFSPDALPVLVQACRGGLNSPWCSSAGRLFDAVASLLGLHQHCSFEGQAAIALEALALQHQDTQSLSWSRSRSRAGEPAGIPRYRLMLRHGHGPVPWEWDWRPLLRALLRDVQQQALGRAAIALAFHHALAAGIAELAAALDLRRILLSGGCFQNRVLLEATIAALEQQGTAAIWPQRLPCNDGALAAGQLLASPTTADLMGRRRSLG